MPDTAFRAQNCADIDLSFVIPVYNAEEYLDRITNSALALKAKGISVEIIYVDDGSTDNSREKMSSLAGENPEVRTLFNTRNEGAGHARNLGWGQVRGRYTIFFDVDDVLHIEAIPGCIRKMDKNPTVDATIFAYQSQRSEDKITIPMANRDRGILNGNLENGQERIASLNKMSSLLLFTNYPWNKVIRTDHYKGKALRFGKTKVNNDILGHWMTLIQSRNIMLLDEVLCTHIVLPKGNNLTNLFNRDRLQVFDALEELYDFLEENPIVQRRYNHFFWTQTARLTDWIRPKLSESEQQEFNMRFNILLSRLPIEDLARMRVRRDPNTADKIVRALIQ